MPHSRRVTFVTLVGASVVVVALVVGVFVVLGKESVVLGKESVDEQKISADGKVSWSRLTVVSAEVDQPLSIQVADLSQRAFEDMRSLTDSGALVGTPVEITADGDVPSGGIRITKSYPVPLPRDMSTTLAYFDPSLGAWKAVPSTVADDRRSVTAVVDHLSVWNDIVSGVGSARQGFVDAVSDAGGAVVSATTRAYGGVEAFNRKAVESFGKGADVLYYGVGKVFDTRVSPPSCHGTLPEWVDDVTFIETQRNNSILWCAGRDAKRPDLVEVKARVNRGFGFSYSTSTTPDWLHNSGLDVDAFEDALDAVTSTDNVLAESVREITAGDHLVGPGDEISFGFTEKAVRSATGKPLVELKVLPATGFLATSLAELVTQYGVDQADGLLGAVIGVASCSRGVAKSSDLLAAAHAVLTCLQAADEDIARHLATAMAKEGGDPKTIGQKAGRIVGKVSVGLGLIGPVFSSMNYTAERHLDAGARQLTVFPTQNAMSKQTIGPSPLLGTSWSVHGGGLEIGRDGHAKSFGHGVCPDETLDSTDWCNDVTEFSVTTVTGGLKLTITRTYVRNEQTGKTMPASGDNPRVGSYYLVKPYLDSYLITELYEGTSRYDEPGGNGLGNPYLCNADASDPRDLCGA